MCSLGSVRVKSDAISNSHKLRLLRSHNSPVRTILGFLRYDVVILGFYRVKYGIYKADQTKITIVCRNRVNSDERGETRTPPGKSRTGRKRSGIHGN